MLVDQADGSSSRGGQPLRDLRLDDLFREQVRRRPDAEAVIGTRGTFSYGELAARADRLARVLHRHGLCPGQLAAVHVGRSADTLVALLGVLGAGGAWVPLDPALPAARMRDMLEDARPCVIVTERALAGALPPSGAAVVCLDELPVDDPREMLLLPRPSAEDLAYVIFTSGTTGRPKGVQVPHRAVVNLIESMRREPGISEQDPLLALTTLSFDLSLLELFLPLASGGRVVIAPREAALDPAAFAALIERHHVGVVQATPSLWRMLVAAGWKGNPRLRILCGGEPLSRDLANALLARCGTLWNLYGPTETTIWSTLHRVGPGVEVPIGRPVAHTRVHVLDAEQRPVVPGQVGELYIAGAGVALGYRDRADLTAQRFLPDPFDAGPMYRTGDLVQELSTGDLVCRGRADSQVKIRGHRVELEEIETLLRDAPGVQHALVTAVGMPEGDQQLVAGVVLRDGHRLDVPRLRRHLGLRLPHSMVPEAFVPLDAIPTTPNGKSDRAQLAASVNRGPAPPIRPGPAQSTAPLSFGQEAHWLLDRMVPGISAFHLPLAFRLRGPLSVPALERALAGIVTRHDALRTVYELADGEPRQRVMPPAPIPVPVAERSTLADALELFADELARPFDLAQDAMLRALVVRLGEEDHALLIVTHHIACDGYSLAILTQELAAGYDGRAAASAPPVRYADFARWERERVTRPDVLRAVEWWRQALDRAPAAGRPRPPCGPGARATLELDASLVELLGAVGRGQNVTLFTVLLAAADVLLMDLTGRDDVLVGVPVANRTQKEVRGLIGLFVNMLVHRTSLAGNPTFGELIARVRQTCRDAHAHGALPYEMLVRELQPPPGLVPVLFGMEAPDEALRLGAATATALPVELRSAMFDLSLHLTPGPAGIRVDAEYRRDAFTAPQVDRLLARYRAICEAIAADVSAPAGVAVSQPVASETRPVATPLLPAPARLERLLPLWEEVLGIAPIGPEESFFDLGGHSLLAVRLFTRVEEALGGRPPLLEWLGDPTPQRMAGLLERAEWMRPEQEALVRLQPAGDRAPFFWVHGLNGSIFTDLLRHIGTDQPWYGFRIAGLNGQEPPVESVTRLAEGYVERLRSVQPEGPYFLGGYCFGGLVALAMARLLCAQGQRVGALVIIELTASHLRTSQPRSPWRSMGRLVAGVTRMAASEPLRLVALAATRVRSLSRRLTTPADPLADYAGTEAWSEDQRRVARVHHRAAREHVVEPYAGRVTLIRGTEPAWRRYGEDTDLGWGALARAVDVHWVEGAQHNDIVHEPHARRTAEALRAVLSRSWEASSRRSSADEA